MIPRAIGAALAPTVVQSVRSPNVMAIIQHQSMRDDGPIFGTAVAYVAVVFDALGVQAVPTEMKLWFNGIDRDDEPTFVDDLVLRDSVRVNGTLYDGVVVGSFDPPEAGEYRLTFEVTQPIKVSAETIVNVRPRSRRPV